MSGDNLVTTIEVYVNGEHVETKEFDATIPAFTIGSGPDALFTIEAEGVSPLHAVINQNDRVISDLGPGGIKINGSELNSNEELSSGDSIEIGTARLSITFSGGLSDDATDPNLDATLPDAITAATSSSNAVNWEEEEEEDEGYVIESGLEYILRIKSEKMGKGTDLLEVNQLIGPEIWDIKHFAPSEADITIGKDVGYRFRFVGKPVAWVPGFFSKFGWLMYPFTEANREWKSDFYNSTNNNQGTQSLFTWNGDAPVCKIHKDWTGWLYKDKLIKFADVLEQGKFVETAEGYEYTIENDTCVIIETGDSVFIAGRVAQGKAITGGMTADMDYPFIGLISALAIIFSLLTYYIIVEMERPDINTSDMEERFAELLLEEPPEPPEEEKKDANPDAGEGAKAKEEEGKVGKKDAKMKESKGQKAEIDKRQQDQAMVDSFAEGMFDSDNSNPDLAGLDPNTPVGGLIGAKGPQAGSGGLGSSGGGFGGGGTAGGLGGMGTKGSGKGSSGWGQGAGSKGKKREGGSIKSGGSPIVLGALDKSLIDKVIKRNMNQIKYCYSRELTKNPKLKGKVIVKFTIAGDGTVSQAGIKSSSLNSKAVEDCITGRFRRFKFPEPKGGGIVIVSYPFLFSS